MKQPRVPRNDVAEQDAERARRQVLAAEEAAAHARRQADAAEKAVGEAQRALRIAVFSLVVASLAAVATLTAPLVGQWATDRAKAHDQSREVVASINDLVALMTDAQKYDCGQCSAVYQPDEAVEDISLRHSLSSNDLRPLGLARHHLVEHLKTYTLVRHANSIDENSAFNDHERVAVRPRGVFPRKKIQEDVARIMELESRSELPVDKAVQAQKNDVRAFFNFVTETELYRPEIEAAYAINVAGAAIEGSGNICVSSKGYPFIGRSLIRTRCGASDAITSDKQRRLTQF